ncbi:MAG: hypothetical protein KAJ19_17000, partial [Gammaproteobacteria bacterium]|nr:hypothetical protein [Gammaproteobacteria bacterium]
MKKQMKKIAFALFAVSCLMLTTVSENSMSYAAEKDKDETSREVSKVFKDEEIKATAKLLTAANYFKRIFLTDYEKALLIFSEDKVIKQFKTLNKEIWVDTPPELGWSLFMSASVHVAGGVEGRTPIVGFYYPYGDVFLMTEWNMNEEIPKITDVEVVMGDFIRTETKELTAIPHWLRTKMFKPFALGDSVAKSIAAFEKLFGTEPVSNWRKKLPVLKKKEVLSEVNYPASALMIFNTLRNIDDFRAANKEINPRLA